MKSILSHPAIDKFVEKNGYKMESAVKEIYDVPNKRIGYRKETFE